MNPLSTRIQSPPRRSRWLNGAFAALALTSLSAIPSASAAEFLNEPLRDGALPTGWTQTDVSFETGGEGYARFDEAPASLTSPVFDASAADSLTLSYSVAQWGAGDGGPLTIEYSLNGGDDWMPLANSSVPDNADYIDDERTIPSTSATMAIRFTRPDSPSRKRLRDVVVADADAPLPALEIISFIPAPGASEVPLEPTLSLTFNQSIQAGTGQIRMFESVTDDLVEAVDVTSLLITGDTLSTGLSAPLDMDTAYYMLLDGGAVEDLAGVPFAGIADSTVWSFTTLAPDTTGPVPASFIPSSGSNNVSLDTFELTVFFDEEIFIVGTDDIEIRRLVDDSLFEAIDPMDIFSVLKGDPEQLILLLIDSLEVGTEYYVFFPAGTVEDEFGNPSLAFGAPTSDIPWTFTTFAPLVLEDGVPYEEDFLGFTGVIDVPANLPSGWFANGPVLNYGGDWGFGFLSGFRGNNSVLGYQHTGSTGTLVKGVTLVNNTGTEITELTISYRGRVERPTEGRSPAYVVEVDGIEAPALAYSTAEGDNVLKQAVVSGLSIAPGVEFTITWTSDNVPAGSGSRKQIGISEVSVSNEATALPPSLGTIAASPGSVSQTSFEVTANLLGDGGSAISGRGFVIAETPDNAEPEIGGIGVTTITDPDTALGVFSNVFSGLDPATDYSVRAYATNAEGTGYSSVLAVTTLQPVPSFFGGYTQGFDNFDGSLPAGWTALSSTGANNYVGPWGSGTAGGFRGGVSDPGVLGYQHTGSTGVLTLTLELSNDTGDTVTQLFVSYLGRVARETQGRSPFWTVEIDGVEVPELSYSTASGVDELVEFTVTGLNIPAGETFTISWSSTLGSGSGSNRQIGIAEVAVEAVFSDVDAPVFSIASGTYFEDQTVFITNFGSYDPSVEVRYTLDGSDPAAGVGLVYDNATGISVADGNGAFELRAIALNTDTSLFSLISARTYDFPTNVSNVAAFRSGSPGTLYRITGEVIVLHRNAFRNRHYVRDGSGSLTIWDEAGELTTEYAGGDGVTGFVGTYNVVNNGAVITMQAATDAGPATSMGAVEPELVNIADLNLSHTGNLVRINNVSFGSPGVFANGANYNISNAFGGSVVRTDFFGMDYIGEAIPDGPVDLIAIVGGFGANAQITPRNLADFLPATPPSVADYASWIAGFDVGDQDGPNDNPSGDGIPNLLKHILGLAPNVANNGPVVEVSASGAGAITIVHNLAKEIAGDVGYGYEWSVNLADWAADGDTMDGVTVSFTQPLIIDGSNVDYDVVKVDATVTAGSATTLFVRLTGDLVLAME